MKIVYSSKFLLKKADEIRQKSPKMLKENDWDGIKELLSIDEDLWAGPSADSYRKLVDSLLVDKSRMGKAVIAIIPDAIEADVRRIQEADRRVADLIHHDLG